MGYRAVSIETVVYWKNAVKYDVETLFGAEKKTQGDSIVERKDCAQAVTMDYFASVAMNEPPICVVAVVASHGVAMIVVASHAVRMRSP